MFYAVAVLPLRYRPDPVLRQRARRVREIDSPLRLLVADMIDTMRHHSGVGLAATQVGVSLRVLVIELPEQAPFVLVNPEIVRRSGEREVEEGCLSIPGYRGKIKRSATVTVKGMDLEGREVRIKGEDLLAEALEHEMDHLNGVLYVDHLEKEDDLYQVEPPPAPMAA